MRRSRCASLNDGYRLSHRFLVLSHQLRFTFATDFCIKIPQHYQWLLDSCHVVSSSVAEDFSFGASFRFSFLVLPVENEENGSGATGE
jgi:hypothetical protein